MGDFYTETLRADPRFHSVACIADPALLEPTFRAKVLAVIADAKANGHDLRLVETFRSQARQEALFRQGKTELAHVGVHGFGLAADLVFFDHGKPNYDDSAYALLGHLAQAHGLIWGGDWGEPHKAHRFRDFDHVQRIRVEDQEKLFRGSWYPDARYTP